MAGLRHLYNVEIKNVWSSASTPHKYRMWRLVKHRCDVAFDIYLYLKFDSKLLGSEGGSQGVGQDSLWREGALAAGKEVGLQVHTKTLSVRS
jgi:hypothetical protein